MTTYFFGHYQIIFMFRQMHEFVAERFVSYNIFIWNLYCHIKTCSLQKVLIYPRTLIFFIITAHWITAMFPTNGDNKQQCKIRRSKVKCIQI